jgi:uncharacterized protein
MSDLERLAHLLAESSDRENPAPGTLREIVAGIRRIAVVGISRDPLKDARRVPSYLAAKGVEVIPVNPNAEWLLGRPSHAELDEVREPLDLVLVFRPSHEAGVHLLRASHRPERPAVWLQEGIRADEAASAARTQGNRVIQDLCLFKAHRALRENLPQHLVRRRDRLDERDAPPPG